MQRFPIFFAFCSYKKRLSFKSFSPFSLSFTAYFQKNCPFVRMFFAFCKKNALSFKLFSPFARFSCKVCTLRKLCSVCVCVCVRVGIFQVKNYNVYATMTSSCSIIAHIVIFTWTHRERNVQTLHEKRAKGEKSLNERAFFLQKAKNMLSLIHISEPTRPY